MDLIKQMVLPGVSLEEVEFNWAAGAEMSSIDDRVTLYWRIAPYRITAESWAETGKKYAIGQLSLTPARRQLHALANEEERVRAFRCRFDPDWLTYAADDKVDWISSPVEQMFNLNHLHIQRAMRRLAEEVVRPQRNSNRLSANLCQSIAIDLARTFAGQSPARAALASKLRDDHLLRIRSLVNAADGPVPDAGKLAEAVEMDARSLRRKFHASAGQSLHDFLEEAKLARACALLGTDSVPLKVVAHLCGFARHSSFSYAFKRRTGRTPGEYRRWLSQ